MVTFSEDFEQGTLGAPVTEANTGFWGVVYWRFWDDGDGVVVEHPEENMIRFTDDAFNGGLAATIPPEVMTAASYESNHLEMTLLGSSPANTIIDEPVEITWLYKYVTGPEGYFGRNIFEASFDKIGNPILDYTYQPPGPDTDYRTSLGLALEHNDDAGQWLYQHWNITDAYPGHATEDEISFPAPPQNVWLKMTFTWAGAGLPFTMRIVDATNEGTVYLNSTLTAPAGLGFSYWNFFAITHREDRTFPTAEGYDFQNWFDGISVAPIISGRPDNVRRRFYY